MKTERPENIFSLQVLKGKVNVTTDFTSTEVDKRNDDSDCMNRFNILLSSLKKSMFLLTMQLSSIK